MDKQEEPRFSNKAKLPTEARHEICRLIAEYTPPFLIRSYVEDYYGIRVTLTNINHYKKSKRWQGLIVTLRNYFLANIEKIPMSHKAVRMARLEILFNHAVVNGEVRVAVAVLRQSQVEMEGIKVQLGSKEFSPTADMTDDDIVQLLTDAQAQGVRIVIPGGNGGWEKN